MNCETLKFSVWLSETIKESGFATRGPEILASRNSKLIK